MSQIVRAIFYFKLKAYKIQISKEMELHDSPATTNQSKQTFHLLTQANLKSHLKRPYQPQPDSACYETTRKIAHLDPQATADKAHTPKRKAILDQNSEEIKQMDQKDGQNQYRDPVVTTPLREKYAHLIPDFQGAEYNSEHRMLMRIQTKIDEHLMYSKSHRGRRRGDFFKSIHKNLYEGCHIIIQLYHFKQILFLDPSLYLTSRQKDKDNTLDILIDLPANADLQLRRSSFKQHLYNYLKDNQALEKDSKRVVIPLYKFSFEEKIEQKNINMVCRRELAAAENVEQAKKQDKERLTLKNMFNKDFKFKQALLEKIAAKQNKIKQQALAAQQVKKYGRDQVLKVLDEVHLAYASKKISNMFRATLLTLVSHRMSLQDHLIAEIFEVLCEQGQGYMKKIEHSKGLILQIDRQQYTSARQHFMISFK